jgi:hypothetical protein
VNRRVAVSEARPAPEGYEWRLQEIFIRGHDVPDKWKYRKKRANTPWTAAAVRRMQKPMPQRKTLPAEVDVPRLPTFEEFEERGGLLGTMRKVRKEGDAQAIKCNVELCLCDRLFHVEAMKRHRAQRLKHPRTVQSCKLHVIIA